jgi:hypothetical protein
VSKLSSRRHARRRDGPRRVRLSHWRSDGGQKTRFATEAEAERAAFQYRLEHGTDLVTYNCEFCGGWHLGNA